MPILCGLLRLLVIRLVVTPVHIEGPLAKLAEMKVPLAMYVWLLGSRADLDHLAHDRLRLDEPFFAIKLPSRLVARRDVELHAGEASIC